MLGFIIVAGLWGFGNFGHFSFGPTQSTSTPAAETYYYITADGDKYVTADGDYYVPAH